LSKKLYKSIFFIVQTTDREDKSVINNKLSQYTDPSIQKIIYFYPDIFRELLLSNLFPDRSIFYKINTENISPVNINIYFLSDKKLRKQKY